MGNRFEIVLSLCQKGGGHDGKSGVFRPANLHRAFKPLPASYDKPVQNRPPDVFTILANKAALLKPAALPHHPINASLRLPMTQGIASKGFSASFARSGHGNL
jgi:hypothetical protein